MVALIKRVLGYVVGSLIKLGQSLLELDCIGFDAMCIGLAVIGLHQLRNKIGVNNSDIND